MTDFLLELRSEEIPARMQAKARGDLEKLFGAQLSEAGLKAESITVYSTPRRLALIAKNLPDATEAVSEEAKGPPEGAPDQAVDGFCRKQGVTRDDLEVRDVKGRPTWFAVINRPGRATREVLAEAIPAIIRAFPWPKSQRWGEASISTESLRWVRPLSGIIALFGGEVVDMEIDGIKAGRETMGHRFMGQPSGVSQTVRAEPVELRTDRSETLRQAQGERPVILIDGVDDYAAKLRDAYVIIDHDERANIIRDGAAKAASDAGLSLVEDEGLVVENAGLTEWPVPLLGRFDESFLDVPEEVIQLSARSHQKYFVCTSPLPQAGGAGGGPEKVGKPTPNPSRKREGNLANAFVCTANLEASDGGKAVVEGNQKVLAARLSDAKFFWELDQKTPLAKHAKKLENIVFHEKLGTVADKVERVAKLARWLCEEGIVKSSPQVGEVAARSADGGGPDKEAPTPNPSPQGGGAILSKEKLADLAERAAKLCKADLVTEMVGEFPDLQGLMGGYYAEKEGLPQEVAGAIRDHYKPVGQGDEVPTAPVTVAVSLADKLDTISTLFASNNRPTGSKDPFALRRAAIGVASIVQINELRLSLIDAICQIIGDFDRAVTSAPADHSDRRGLKGQGDGSKNNPFVLYSVVETRSSVLAFFADRLKVQQKEAGVRHDLIDAVFALGGEDDLVRLLARVKALQSFMDSDDGANLLAGYKRAANILKQAGIESSPPVGEVAARSADGGGLDNEAPTPNPSPQGGGEPEEKALLSALDAAEPKAAIAIEAEKFEDAMSALASLRGAVDAFFDNVMVNDEDEAKRNFRLGLLARFRDAVHAVADFSKIEG